VVGAAPGRQPRDRRATRRPHRGPASFAFWRDVLAAYREQVRFFAEKMEQLERINR
jgi:hypothetical protein